MKSYSPIKHSNIYVRDAEFIYGVRRKVRDFKSERKQANAINCANEGGGRERKKGERESEGEREQKRQMKSKPISVCVSVAIFLVTHYCVAHRCLPGTLMSVGICMNKLPEVMRNFSKRYHKRHTPRTDGYVLLIIYIPLGVTKVGFSSPRYNHFCVRGACRCTFIRRVT